MELDYFGVDAQIERLEASLSGARDATHAPALATLAWYLRQRDPGRALALADEAQALVAPAGAEADALRARLLLVRGEIQCLTGEHAHADLSLQQALKLGEVIADPLILGDAHMQHAQLLCDMGRESESLAAVKAASDHYAVQGDRVRHGVSTLWHASLQLRVHGIAAAKHAGDLLDTLDTTPHPGLEMQARWLQGILLVFHGDFGTAIRHSQQAFKLAMTLGQPHRAISAAIYLCIEHGNLADFATGLEWLERALDIARPLRWPLPTALLLSHMSFTLALADRRTSVPEILREARALLEPFQDSLEWVDHCVYTAAALNLVGQHADEALESYRLGELGALRLGHVDLVLRGMTGQAISNLKLGRREQALAEAQRAKRYIEQINERGGQSASSQLIWANLMMTFARIAKVMPLPLPDGSPWPNASIHYVKEAMHLYSETSKIDPPFEWFAELSLAYEDIGELAAALDFERRASAVRQSQGARRAAGLATATQVRYETERAKADAEHQRVLVEVEARRADAEAQANQAKSTFLANMSHELRSPLNAMLGFSRLLLRDGTLSDGARHDVGIVLASGEHLYGLINQVLELSKIEAGRISLDPMPFDIHSLLQELRSMFEPSAREKGLHLAVGSSSSVPRHLVADAVKLRQVLINLLSNAFKFTPKGTIELQVKAIDGTRLSISVVDTGVGIAREELASLGEAFAQARAGRQAAEGTGLGLAISRSFVRLMGGELTLVSEPSQGTTVRFDIPLQAARPDELVTAFNPEPAPVRQLTPGTPRPRILAVDDWPESRQLLVRLLTPLGFEVREAANGQEAIDAWRQWQPQLILMDMRMPVLDGREATRRIRAAESGGHTCIVALTASSFEEERAEILAHGCDDFLRKPFREKDLLDMLAHHLGLRYEYDTVPPSRQAEEPVDACAGRLGSLPQPLRERLRSAVSTLDVKSMEEVLLAIRRHDAETAAMLAPLAERFDYQRINTLLDGEP